MRELQASENIIREVKRKGVWGVRAPVLNDGVELLCQVLRMRGIGVVWELSEIRSRPAMQVESAPGTFTAGVAENLLKKQKAVRWRPNKHQRQLARLTWNERRNVDVFDLSFGWEEQ